MALFSMRDSWNVWRRKVDAALGGMVEPVKSEDVTYDNTDSGLTATNVQSAIDEVAGVLDGKSVIKNAFVTIEKTGDGVKTVSAIMDEIAAEFKTVIEGLEDGEFVSPLTFFAGGYAWMGAIGLEGYTNATTSFGPVFARTTINASNNTTAFYYAALQSVAGNCILNGTNITTAPAVSIASGLANVPADGAKFQLTYRVYKTL